MAVSATDDYLEPLVSLRTGDDSDPASLVLQDRTLFDMELKMSGNWLGFVRCRGAAQEANALQFLLHGVFVAIRAWCDLLARPCSFQ